MQFTFSQRLNADLMASSQSGLHVQPGSQVTVDGSYNIYYVTTAQAIHQMSWGTNQYVDVSINAQLLVEPGTGVTEDTSGSVYYVDAGQTVHKMYISGGQWVDANLMASTQSGYFTAPGVGVAVDGSANVYYVDAGQTIHEMYWTGTQFVDANLMASSGSGMKVSVAFLITGQVTSGGAALNGVSVTLSGTTASGTSVSQTTTTATVNGSDGQYSFLVADGGSYTGTASSANYTATFTDVTASETAAGIGPQVLGGCTFGPYTSCTDPVPATFLSGSWSDGGTGTLQITANDGSPAIDSSTASGTLTVKPGLPGCPVSYTWTLAELSSNFNPSGIVPGQEGSTRATWVFNNPNPSQSCTPSDGSTPWTPDPTVTFKVVIANKANSVGSGTRLLTTISQTTDTSPITLTRAALTPSGESISLDTTYNQNGWGRSNSTDYTQLHILQTLTPPSGSPTDPNGNMFMGRQVYEVSNGTPSDACFIAARPVVDANGNHNPSSSAAILGTVWNVGANVSPGNQYGDDTIGWTVGSVNWYQTNLPASAFPCTATLTQKMMIVDAQGNHQFAMHTLTYTLTKTSVTVSKDGISQTLAYSQQ